MNTENVLRGRIRARWWGVIAMAAMFGLLPLLTQTSEGQEPIQVRERGFEDGRYVFSDLAEAVLPSVVTVYVRSEPTEQDRRRLERQRDQLRQFRDFFDPRLRELLPPELFPDEEGEGEGRGFRLPTRSGSGVIVSKDGHIVTNMHVLGRNPENSDIRIVFANDEEISGDEVVFEYGNMVVDLAVLKVDPDAIEMPLQPLRWADNYPRIGERVAAVGSPLDLRQTITQGIVAAVSRDIDVPGLGDMIQTDAVINPGSSGGPLVNMDGEVVGINRLITSATGLWAGYGFAIPAADARFFVENVIRTGRVEYGYLGIHMGRPGIEDVARMRRALGIDPDLEGVLVTHVAADGPAEAAGMEELDFITHINQTRIEGNNDLLRTVMRTPVGEQVQVRVLRGGDGDEAEELTLTLEVGVRPPDQVLDDAREMPIRPPRQPDRPEPDEERSFMGMSLEPHQEGDLRGLRVTEVERGSVAQRQGMQRGDIITQVNRRPVETVAQLQEALARRTDDYHLIQYIRDGNREHTVLYE